MSLDKLINLHLKPSDTLSNRRLITNSAGYFIKIVSAYLVTDSRETFYDVPYDRMTDIIFSKEYDYFEKSELDELKTAVNERIEEYFRDKEIPKNIRDMLNHIVLEEGETLDSICIKHITACYRKFVGHIGLAVIQKNFITKSAAQANRMAHEAKNESEKAQELSKKLIDTAENSTTQYISILGVFAAIIAALFGGMNLIRGAVDLLENNGSLMVLALVISLLLTCFCILIMLLMNWVNSIRNPNLVQDYNSLVKKIIVFLLIFSFVMGLSVYNHREKISNLAKSNLQNELLKSTPH